MDRAALPDALVVGAGISGLSLAQAMSGQGFTPLVLERAAGVGGRCATRRVGGWPVDHGTPFLHGRDAEFLAALDSVTDATPVPGWPQKRIGGGIPCQPEAFEGRDRLMAYREGLTRFPKHLARGLDVRLGAAVSGLRLVPDEPLVEAVMQGGASHRAGVVALSVPAAAAGALLDPLAQASPAVAAALPVLDQVRMLPCLAVIAQYGPGATRPDWDVCFPADSTMVHAILHDSAKRAPGAPLTLVVQGRPRFSREFLSASPSEWSHELLWEAGEFLGSWVERPVAKQEHVWKYARVDATSELAAPLMIPLEQGAVLALCGDAFSPSGGAEGAFRSGRHLAARIVAHRGTPLERP